ncbi:MAG: NlpC/P60 family protein [Verrucomicrobiales bacterium]
MTYRPSSHPLILLGLACLGACLVPRAEAGLFSKRHDAPRPSPPPANRFPVPPPNPYLDPESAPPRALPATAPSAPVAQPVRYERPVFHPTPSVLPFSDYEFPRRETTRRGFFFFGANDEPSDEMLRLIAVLRARAEHLSRFGLSYKFGGDHPSEGGMDCSGTMKFLIAELGFKDMPRTSYHQYGWLRQHRTLQHTKSIPEHMGGRKGIKPGDLIFWGGTYNSGHRVSHVMIYLGQGGDGTHYMFGARGKKKRGLNGSGVDIFELDSGYQKGLVGFGSLPGVS